MKNYYEILQVSRNSSFQVIKAAYRQLAQIHHPDKTGNSSDVMQEINEAYSVLGDPEKRELYDAELNAFEKAFEASNFQAENEAKGNNPAASQGPQAAPFVYEKQPKQSPKSQRVYKNYSWLWKAIGIVACLKMFGSLAVLVGLCSSYLLTYLKRKKDPGYVDGVQNVALFLTSCIVASVAVVFYLSATKPPLATPSNQSIEIGDGSQSPVPAPANSVGDNGANAQTNQENALNIVPISFDEMHFERQIYTQSEINKQLNDRDARWTLIHSESSGLKIFQNTIETNSSQFPVIAIPVVLSDKRQFNSRTPGRMAKSAFFLYVLDCHSKLGSIVATQEYSGEMANGDLVFDGPLLKRSSLSELKMEEQESYSIGHVLIARSCRLN